MAQYDLEEANKHTLFHREELLQSELCGCFHCKGIFPPGEITEWKYPKKGVGTTAVCPMCGMDTVIGSASGYPIIEDFLEQMYLRWFEAPFGQSTGRF